MNKHAVAVCLKIYKITVSDNQATQVIGRHSNYFQSDRKKRVAEILATVAIRNDVSSIASNFSKVVQDALNFTSCFGCSRDMVACGVERNGLGNLRYQHHGKRLVIVVAFPRVQKFVAAKGITMMEKESVADFGQRVL